MADFDGVCSGRRSCLEPRARDLLLPELLPFVDAERSRSTHRSVAQSKARVNPDTNWKDLAWFEFDLPPIDVQRRIAELLWSGTDGRMAGAACAKSAACGKSGTRSSRLGCRPPARERT